MVGRRRSRASPRSGAWPPHKTRTRQAVRWWRRAEVLPQSLRSLERAGLVKRTAHADNTPHVEYELTPLGRTMLEPLAAACTWAEEHWDELLDARESYDDTNHLDRAG
jgi:DNA-binding PadR family transcriptional regulator